MASCPWPVLERLVATWVIEGIGGAICVGGGCEAAAAAVAGPAIVAYFVLRTIHAAAPSVLAGAEVRGMTLNGTLIFYVPPPKVLPGFKDAERVRGKTPVRGGGGLRARWKTKDGKIIEWDSQHGKVEVYSPNGKHLGEFDPVTGQQTKPPVPGRPVEK